MPGDDDPASDLPLRGLQPGQRRQLTRRRRVRQRLHYMQHPHVQHVCCALTTTLRPAIQPLVAGKRDGHGELSRDRLVRSIKTAVGKRFPSSPSTPGQPHTPLRGDRLTIDRISEGSDHQRGKPAGLSRSWPDYTGHFDRASALRGAVGSPVGVQGHRPPTSGECSAGKSRASPPPRAKRPAARVLASYRPVPSMGTVGGRMTISKVWLVSVGRPSPATAATSTLRK